MADVEPLGGVEPRFLASPPSVARERALAELAAQQYGVVGRDQLVRLGFTPDAIRHRLRCGRLRRIHHNIYAVGAAPLNQHGHWWAALLAARPSPCLSHLSSLAKRGLARERGRIHVTVTHRRGRNLDGVAVHRCRSLDPADLTRIDGMPVTTLARTLIDLAESEPRRVLEAALEEADRRGLLDPGAIRECAARCPGRRGLAVLLPLVDGYVPTPDAKEGLERKFQLFLRERGLPPPLVNTLVHGYLVDCWWPDARLVVELDSRGWHSHWDARERDVVRDSTLQRHEVRAIRVTDRRISAEPDELEADLRALLLHAA
jgi:very-short-patch-repair endonuclease